MLRFFTSKTDVERLQEKSGNIVNVFNKVITDLKAVNDKADASKTQKTEQRNKLDEQIISLGTMKEQNLKVISNIEKILT